MKEQISIIEGAWASVKLARSDTHSTACIVRSYIPPSITLLLHIQAQHTHSSPFDHTPPPTLLSVYP